MGINCFSFIVLALIGGIFIGLIRGETTGCRNCANEAIKKEPAIWWRKAIIHAKARQDAEQLHATTEKQ